MVVVEPVSGLVRVGYTTKVTRVCVHEMAGKWKSGGMPKTLAFFPALSYIRDTEKIT
jgi:hypothetical protein